MKTRTIIAHLSVMLELRSQSVAATTLSNTLSVDEAVEQIQKIVDSIITSYGFEGHPEYSFTTRFSGLNGGYAKYTTYILLQGDIKIKLILDVRVADHPSKPDLLTKNENRSEDIDTTIREEFNKKTPYSAKDSGIGLLDVQVKQQNWGYQFYVGSGKDTNYSGPVSDIEGLTRIIQGKLSKLVSKYI